MRSKLGSATLATVLSLAGLGALGMAGYSAVTGQTLCSMMHACPASESKDCLKDGAKITTVANTTEKSEKSECSKSCAKTCGDKTEGAAMVNASNTEKSGCAKTCGAKTEGAAMVNASNTEKSGCAKTCGAKTEAVANAKDCASKCAGVCYSKTMVMGSANAVVMPAAFFKDTGSFCTSKLEAAGCCKGGAKVENISNTGEKTEAGCCKGSGKRADGKPCCGKCTAEKTGEKTASAS